MEIAVYVPVWNEERMLPYFLQHYETFVDHIFVFDSGSDDRTIEIARDHPKTTLIEVDTGGSADADFYVQVKGHVWKRHTPQADWIIGVDCDEFIYHPYIRAVLRRYLSQGITLPRIRGYYMFAEAFPESQEPLTKTSRIGVYHKGYSKLAVYSNQVEINYEYCCHDCRPTGRVVRSEKPEINLLHYRWLGLDWVKQRYSQLRSRIKNNYQYGEHYLSSDETLEAEHAWWRSRVCEVI